MNDHYEGAGAASEAAHADGQPTPSPAEAAERMTDENAAGDHWNQLASVLGAKVREDVPPAEPQQAHPGDEMSPNAGELSPAQPVGSPAPPADKPRRPRPSANWDALAATLGIEAQAESPTAPSAPAPKSQLHEPPAELAMSTEQLAETVKNLSESLRSAPASLGHEPTVLIAEETVAVFVERGEEPPEELDEVDDSEAPARGRSKHRRRRPRSDQRQAGPEDSDTEPVTAVEPEESGDVAEADADETRRPKRRRPRRRRQKSDSADAKTGARPEPESDEFDAGDALDSGERRKSSGRETGGEKAGHRSIPAWQEAIGIIVEKNLGARSTKSAGGQAQKRGRRSPRRGGGKPG